MISKLSTQITQYAISHNIIQPEEYNIYYFAFLSLIERILSWGFILLVGIMSRHSLGTFAFLCSFIPLRIYAGGFHARKYKSCFASSSIAFVLMILIYRLCFINIASPVLLSLLMASYIITWGLAPLEDENKPLDASEYSKYQKRTRVILSLESIIAIILLLSNTQRQISAFIVMGITMESILLLLSPKK